jgi:hypothetical protein
LLLLIGVIGIINTAGKMAQGYGFAPLLIFNKKYVIIYM